MSVELPVTSKTSQLTRSISAEETKSIIQAERLVSNMTNAEKENNLLDKSPEKKTEKLTCSLKVFQYATGFDKILMICGIFLNACSGLLMPIFMLVFGDLINDLGNPSEGSDFNHYVLIQVYIGIVSFFLSFGGVTLLEYAAERQTEKIRHNYLDAVIRQEMGWFDMFDPGSLATRLNQNCVTVRDGIGSKIGQLFMFSTMFLGGYIVGFIRGWKMTLVLTAVMPLLAIGGFFFMIMLSSAEREAQDFYSKAGAVAEEVLSSIRTIEAFGAEQKSLLRYEVHLDESFKKGVKGGLYVGLGLGCTMCFMFLSYSLGFWYGGKLVSDDIRDGCTDNCFQGGNALAVFFSVIIAAFSIGQAGPSLTAFMKAGTAVEDINLIVRRESKIDPYNTNGIKDVQLTGDIVFRNVQFKYPSRDELNVFSSLNLHIPAGKIVALVGASGCGKSTIIQLVQRFYDPDGGEVLLDGKDVREYNLKWVRDQMSLVSQEPRMFARSIMENIRDGKLDADDSAVEAAAKNANALSFIADFPQGFSTFVGEGGSQLSGGQKQRIAIARAMLRNPTILILDEATSALDNESEKVVQNTIDELISARKRTTIVIAHRLSTIRNADKIIVLTNPTGNGAVIAEEGSHDELLAKENGIYQQLVEAQQMHGVEATDDIMRNQSFLSVRRSFSRGSTNVESLRSLQSKNEDHGNSKARTPELKSPSFLRVCRLVFKHPFKFCLGLIGSMGAGLIFPIFSIIFADFIGVYFQPNPDDITSDSAFYALLFVILAIFALVIHFLEKYFMEWTGQLLVRELRAKTFEQMLYQDIAFFDSPTHATGTLSDILSNDILLVKGWSGDNLGLIVQNVTSLVAALIIAFLASPKLAAVSLAAFFVLAPAGGLQMMFMKGDTKKDDTSVETPGYVINETITNIRTITAYNLQDRMISVYDKVLAKEFAVGKRRAIISGFFWGFSQFLQFGAQALTLWYGGKLLENGDIEDVSTMLRATFALMMAAMGVGQTMVFVTDVKKAKEAGARVYELIDSKPSIDARSPDGLILEKENVIGKIELSNVRFRYPQRPEIPVYKQVTFDIQEGETVALVGASGCGKSTIIQLIERLYDVEGHSGLNLNKSSSELQLKSSIKLDGVDIRDINVKNLRSLMGLVSQEPILFNTTIEENIRYGCEVSTEADIVLAAKKANAHDFITKFPDKYKTIVGKFGGKLSGGQKQRIAIARAILRNPKVLLLDEATSALDAESEKIVQEALDNLVAQEKRTTIIVAHRLSTIKGANKIIVFANPSKTGSKVVEVGTHNELMRIKDGVYRNLVNIAGDHR